MEAKISPKPSSTEKAPRQVKSKHKSRSGCQSCKLRRLKCDETKPECSNCRKKGMTCPGYALRLTWSTKYERPRETTRPEPSNFDQLVSAVTQSIVPDSGPSPSSPSLSTASGRPSEPATSPISYSDPVSTTVGIGPTRPRQLRRQGTSSSPIQRATVTSAPAQARSIPNSSPRSIKVETPMTYTNQPDLVGFQAQAVDTGSSATGSIVVGTPTSVSGDSYWGYSSSSSPGPSSGIENMVMLAASSDVDEPETSLSGSEGEMAAVRPTSQAVVELGHFVPPAPQLSRQLVDVPSFLIQHWFKTVCSGWSAYDSQTNPYRQLSASLWHSSMAVFYALQSMAAASLVEHLPHLKDVARVAPRLAFQAITYEFQSFRSSLNAPLAFPGGLVLSLFCMSSSICWTDSRQFGLQFLKLGRSVLNCLNKYAHALSPSDRELLNFFNGCLVYEEMLRSIVSNDESDMENLASWQVSPALAISVVPHAWTGVSPDLLRLFGKTMVLCRRSQNRWRQGHDSVEERMLKGSLDYQEAIVIEEVLLAIELPPLPHQADYASATEEAKLQRHLHDAAEAYRLSSLLQLYQTFPDLIARRLPLQVDANGFVPYSGWLSPLALHITAILRSIPPSSSMRCLQPLLCLCAGTGLRYDNLDPAVHPQVQGNMFGGPITQGIGLGNPIGNPLGTADPSVFGFSSLSSCAIGETELEIASARRFLMERLGRLEQNLPPKSIQVEKRLLKSIWATYDVETSTNCKTHWLDIMVNNGLESIFG